MQNITSFVKRNFYLISILAITTFSITLRWFLNQNFVGFLGDQGYHGFFINRIASGEFIYLGSSTSASNFFLLPYHYYINAIVALFNPHPVSHVLMNLLFCGLTPLLIYKFLIEELGGDITAKRIGLFVSLMFSVFAYDIWQSGFEWNPNTQNFFVLSLILSTYGLIKVESVKKIFLYGTLVASSSLMLFSTHAASLYTTLFFLVFLGVIAFIKISWRKILSVVVPMFIIGLPYILGEWGNRFENTKALYKFIFSTKESVTIEFRINNLLNIITGWIADVIVSPNLRIVGIFLASILIFLTLNRYHKLTGLARLYFLYLLIYLGIMSGYTGIVHYHYMGVINSLPFICIGLSLYKFNILNYFNLKNIRKINPENIIKYSNWKKWSSLVANDKILSYSVLTICVILFFITNFSYLLNYYRIFVSPHRTVGIMDYDEAFRKNPNNTFCFPYFDSDWNLQQFKLLDQYSTKGNILFSNKCSLGDLIFVEKYNYTVGYTTKSRAEIRQIPTSIQYVQVDEGKAYYIYKVTKISEITI